MPGDARDFNNIETQAVIKSHPQGKEPKEIHAILTQTLGELAPSYATVNLNVVIFPPVVTSSWTTQNSDHPGDYWSNSRASLGKTPDFG